MQPDANMIIIGLQVLTMLVGSGGIAGVLYKFGLWKGQVDTQLDDHHRRISENAEDISRIRNGRHHG